MSTDSWPFGRPVYRCSNVHCHPKPLREGYERSDYAVDPKEHEKYAKGRKTPRCARCNSRLELYKENTAAGDQQ